MSSVEALDPGGGSPAHAGIDPTARPERLQHTWFPRTRGDRPPLIGGIGGFFSVPPHTRG